MKQPWRTHYLKDAIFRALARNPYGLSAEELVSAVYSTEPRYAVDSIYVTIHSIRKMVLPYTIKTVYRCGRRYQLYFT